MHKIYSNLKGFQMLKFLLRGYDKEDDTILISVHGEGWGCSYIGGDNGNGFSIPEHFDPDIFTALIENA
jgi:hypothetical protein